MSRLCGCLCEQCGRDAEPGDIVCAPCYTAIMRGLPPTHAFPTYSLDDF